MWGWQPTLLSTPTRQQQNKNWQLMLIPSLLAQVHFPWTSCWPQLPSHYSCNQHGCANIPPGSPTEYTVVFWVAACFMLATPAANTTTSAPSNAGWREAASVRSPLTIVRRVVSTSAAKSSSAAGLRATHTTVWLPGEVTSSNTGGSALLIAEMG